MSILNYLKTLLPVFGRDRIIEDLRMARTELLETQPALKEIVKVLNSPNFKSEEAKRINKTMQNYNTGRASSDNVLQYALRQIPALVENIETIERMVKTEFSDTVATQGVDLRQLNLIQIADAFSFAARYTRFVANFIVRKEFEAVATAKKVEFQPEDILFESEFIEGGMIPYLIALKHLGQENKKILEALASIPEMSASVINYGELSRTVGAQKIEPFPLSSANFSWSPFYTHRIRNADARDARYRECKAQVTAMQSQLMRYQQANAGKSNPSLEREVAYLTKMIASHASEMESYISG